MEKNILSVVRVIGWLNFYFLILLLITIKGASNEQNIFILITVSISVLGTIIYHLFWKYFFKSTEYQDGLKYFKPYRLGFLVSVGVVVLLTSIYIIE
jgi:hypothetical protein